MTSPLSSPAHAVTPIHRVAIVFAGGPAPAANAVISAAADSFMRNDIEVLGILNGYSNLMQFVPDRPLQEGTGRDYIAITPRMMRRVRNSQGILIGTARANPGKFVSDVSHLDDPEKTKPLRTVYDALCSLRVDALISIGGDDTLKTANKLKLFQDRLPPAPSAFRSCICPRRSTTITRASISRSAISRRLIRWPRNPQPAA